MENVFLVRFEIVISNPHPLTFNFAKSKVVALNKDSERKCYKRKKEK